MIKLIKDVHANWSLKARIALALGFVLGVFTCGFFVHNELSKLDCSITMTFTQYAGIGGVGICIFGVVLFLGGMLVFGTLSAPEAFKEWIENWRANAVWRRREKEKHIECHGRYYSLKVLGGTFVGIAAIVLTITVLGAAVGYLGWLLFC